MEQGRTHMFYEMPENTSETHDNVKHMFTHNVEHLLQNTSKIELYMHSAHIF